MKNVYFYSKNCGKNSKQNMEQLGSKIFSRKNAIKLKITCSFSEKYILNAEIENSEFQHVYFLKLYDRKSTNYFKMLTKQMISKFRTTIS